MPEQLQKILDRILEWWKKFNTKQKALLISIVAVVLVALGILAAVVSQPKMVTLIHCDTTAESGQVKDILDSEGISYELSTDGLSYQVKQEDYANASIVLGTNDIPTSGTDLSSVFDGGFSSTEADKTKKYNRYLEEYYAEKLEILTNVDVAAVTIDMPNDDGTILSKDEQASVTAVLTLNGTMSEEQAEGIAKYLATNVGNDDTSNILILDNKSNVLYSGQDETSATGTANTQLSLKTKAENQVRDQVKSVLTGSDLFNNVEVGLNLNMNFDQTTESTHEYYAPDGQTNGMIGSQSEYESTAEGGAAAAPGTDSNNNNSYVIEDNDYTNSTITETNTTYQNNEKITTTTPAIGTVDYSTSSISIVATNYVVYDEDTLRAAGELDDMTFDEYVAANSEPVKTTVDTDLYTLIANATGVPESNITIVSYDQPMFQYSTSSSRSITDYLQIILAVLIFALLGYVVFRSTRKEPVVEPEPELSVESLLESTKESTDALQDIGFTEKSETRLLIEKFVEENPEAAASLLRNWLNEEWE